MTIAVLGPGGVGGLVAAALARSGEDVVVVAREETAGRIAADGIRVQSVKLGEFVARPAAAFRLEEPSDLLVVATKATSLAGALERVRAEPEIVVPLLNGLDHLPLLRERFGPRAVAGTIRVESHRPEPGRVVQTSPFLRIELASDDTAMRAALPPVVAAFGSAGIPARVGESEAQVIWSKLCRLNALACTTSAYDVPIGPIRDDPERRRTLEAAVAETAAVARAEGARIDPAAVVAELDEAHAELTSSMHRDLSAGRETELDAIAGAVLRAAARHGLGCPTVERLVAEIQGRSAAAASGRSSP